MALSSLIIVILLILLFSYYILAYDNIVKELKEIRLKCINIHGLKEKINKKKIKKNKKK